MLLHSLLGVEALVTDGAVGDRVAMDSLDVLIQVSLVGEGLAAGLALVNLFLGRQLFISMDSTSMHCQRCVGVHMFVTLLAPVWSDSEMPPHMFHKDAHVSEGVVAHAALELGILVTGIGNVDMLKHLALLLEQDVVDGADDLTVVDQSMSLHILPSFELHIAFWTGYPRGTFAALFHMNLDRGTVFL